MGVVYGCDGKVKDIYESKELWRGPESIYRKEGVLALSGDRFEGNTFQLRAIQPIKSNDEIFISYNGAHDEEGSKQLLEIWGFTCCCRQCKEG